MTDNEIVKALECCCEDSGCPDICPLKDMAYVGDCVQVKSKHALDLINRLQAENDTLKNVIKNSFLEKAGCNIDPLAEIKAEAYKEFAELVQGEIDDALHSNYNAKEERHAKCQKQGIHIDPEDGFLMYCDGKIHALSGLNSYIDDLLKEMEGE